MLVWSLWKFNSLWPGDAIWRHGTRSTLAQVMACCLMAPSHYLNQCWLITSKVQRHSSEIPQPPVTEISLKITYLNFFSNLPGANELKFVVSLLVYRLEFLFIFSSHCNLVLYSRCCCGVVMLRLWPMGKALASPVRLATVMGKWLSRSQGLIQQKMSSYQYRNSIVEIRRSYDRLISTMGFPILVRWRLYNDSGPRSLPVFNPECFFWGGSHSRTKNPNDPQNRKQGVKNDPLPFMWKSQFFFVPTCKKIFLMILIIKICEDFWYIPNKNPFIAFNFDLHLLCKIQCLALQVVQHFDLSSPPLAHCIAWLNTTM